MVVSGSCSPVTARQIDWAAANGFADVALRPDEWLPSPPDETMVAHTESVIRHLVETRSVIVHTAKGPDDSRLADVRRRGTGATRQREVYERTGSLQEVVADLAAGTVGGTVGGPVRS